MLFSLTLMKVFPFLGVFFLPVLVVSFVVMVLLLSCFHPCQKCPVLTALIVYSHTSYVTLRQNL